MTQLYIPLSDGFEARTAWKQVAARLGVEVVAAPVVPHALSLSNASAAAIAANPALHYMNATTLAILADSAARGAHFPALPAIAAKAQADLAPLGDGPVFLKPRLNLKKGRAPLAYRRWPSVSAFVAEAWGEFAAYQADPWDGELVVCPDMGNPMTNLEIDFAVNAASEVFLMHTHTHSFTEHDRPGNMLNGAQAPAELMAAIQAFCTARGIKGGIYNIQAVQHAGTWKVMDWNTRPSGMYTVAAGLHPGVADAGLAHMLGIAHQAVPVHIELRSYWALNLPNSAGALARQAGLTPSWIWSKAQMGRVYGIGDTAAEVQAKFNAFEASIA